ncbi:amidohydrolase family protein [Thalassomonas actiniarum]|uniref:Amidohydrolase family protein n=1 Tax=Thalassomonas actiniarum TaxID=485447 RepID=A0AAE9YT99_9GAMM|nr:amidohydrolase family protein [Thalassomonas actiniarum]WDE00367.1 amidohydrolase family protein [Thalassomonas actiniarum]
MRLFKTPLSRVALLLSAGIGAATLAIGSVSAKPLAITHAKVHTVTGQGVLTDATVIIEDGKILAINPQALPAGLSADSIIDAEGKTLTPGFINSFNQLGLVEVSAVGESRDSREKKADITFDPSLAFNPRSSLIPYSRKGGITRNLVTPGGGESIFKGQAFAVDLSGEFDSEVKNGLGVYVVLGGKSKGSRAFDLQTLWHKLEDRQKAVLKQEAKEKTKKEDKSKKDNNGDKEPKRDELILDALLAGKQPLFVNANRASDLLQLIKLKQKFKLDLVLVGAADAALVAKQLADAEVPVVINALRNLPESFDAMHTSLTSPATLMAAGVKVVLNTGGDTHNLYQLRFTAGNAVANGLSAAQALASITANAADVFHLDAGRIAVGQAADLVLWSGDPFELSTRVEKMWIAGEQVGTRSRQDALRERYISKSTQPRAYVK